MSQLPEIEQQVRAEFLARLKKLRAVERPAKRRLEEMFASDEPIKAEQVIAAIAGEGQIP